MAEGAGLGGLDGQLAKAADPSLPRPNKGRQSPLPLVEHQHASCRRRAALGAIGAGTGAAAQADGGGFARVEVYPARGGEWGGEARV